MAQERSQPCASPPGVPFCVEKYRLLNEFLKAIQELVEIQNQQAQAVIQGDSDFARFDVLLHMANERKDHAKYAWMAHVECHHCQEW